MGNDDAMGQRDQVVDGQVIVLGHRHQRGWTQTAEASTYVGGKPAGPSVINLIQPPTPRHCGRGCGFISTPGAVGLKKLGEYDD